ncbi:hypothetical protein [Thalassospira xiamenensis]|uniref:hypothetical protein n=1 Tax=Thalassospira xiamenensis TaxID=220697 RepID=UPI003AA85F5E
MIGCSKIKQSLAIDIPRPRSIDALTSSEFMHYKKTILSLMHDEMVRADTPEPVLA